MSKQLSCTVMLPKNSMSDNPKVLLHPEKRNGSAGSTKDRIVWTKTILSSLEYQVWRFHHQVWAHQYNSWSVCLHTIWWQRFHHTRNMGWWRPPMHQFTFPHHTFPDDFSSSKLFPWTPNWSQSRKTWTTPVAAAIYIAGILRRFKMSTCFPTKTPADTQSHLTTSMFPTTPEGIS